MSNNTNYFVSLQRYFDTISTSSILHVATGASFFTSYCGSMVSEILNDKWQPCEQTIGGTWW